MILQNLDNCRMTTIIVLLLIEMKENTMAQNKLTTSNIRQRSNGLWEGRYRVNGKQCSVYAKRRKKPKISSPRKWLRLNPVTLLMKQT